MPLVGCLLNVLLAKIVTSEVCYLKSSAGSIIHCSMEKCVIGVVCYGLNVLGAKCVILLSIHSVCYFGTDHVQQ